MNVLALRADGTLEHFSGSALNGFSKENFHNEICLDHNFADYDHGNGVLKGVAIYEYADGELAYAICDYFGFEDDAEKESFEAKFGRDIGYEKCAIQDNN